MNFNPLNKKVKDILGGDSCYIIPNFQRNYSWQEKNYKDFVNDLLKSGESYYDSEKHMLVNKSSGNGEYFFGTILLVLNGRISIENPYKVVDGQQRLTTMTIFLAVLIDILEKYSKDYKHKYRDALIIENLVNGQSTDHARLINRALTPVLPVNILNLNDVRIDGAEHVEKNQSQVHLTESYELIKNLLSKENLLKTLCGKDYNVDFLSVISDENYINFIDDLGKQLLNSTLIAIYSDDSESANILFRNFNSRGIPLSGSDLIKNELFANLEESSTDALKRWENMADNIFIADESIDTFLFHFMTSKSFSTTKKNLFDTFSNHVEIDSYRSFLIELEINAGYYKNIAFPQKSDNLFKKKIFG